MLPICMLSHLQLSSLLRPKLPRRVCDEQLRLHGNDAWMAHDGPATGKAQSSFLWDNSLSGCDPIARGGWTASVLLATSFSPWGATGHMEGLKTFALNAGLSTRRAPGIFWSRGPHKVLQRFAVVPRVKWKGAGFTAQGWAAPSKRGVCIPTNDRALFSFRPLLNCPLAQGELFFFFRWFHGFPTFLRTGGKTKAKAQGELVSKAQRHCEGGGTGHRKLSRTPGQKMDNHGNMRPGRKLDTLHENITATSGYAGTQASKIACGWKAHVQAWFI